MSAHNVAYIVVEENSDGDSLLDWDVLGVAAKFTPPGWRQGDGTDIVCVSPEGAREVHAQLRANPGVRPGPKKRATSPPPDSVVAV